MSSSYPAPPPPLSPYPAVTNWPGGVDPTPLFYQTTGGSRVGTRTRSKTRKNRTIKRRYHKRATTHRMRRGVSYRRRH
jgi:hypothetical protein